MRAVGTPRSAGTAAIERPGDRPRTPTPHHSGNPLDDDPIHPPRRVSRWKYATPLLGVVLLAVATLSGATVQPEQAPYPASPLPIATGDRGTVYYAYGYALMQAVRRELPLLRPYLTVTPSDERNIELLTEGTALLGFASADTIASLPSSQTSRLRALARLYEDYLHLVVRRDSGIREVTDLRGKRVSIGLPDSGTQSTAMKLLRAAGISDQVTTRPLGFDASVDAMRVGEIDAFFFFGGVPTTRLSELRPIQLIDLEDWLPKLAGYGSTYTQLSIPASAYHTDAVTTVGVPTYLLVPKDMDPDLAYALTSLLFEQREEMAAVHRVVERLDRRAAINTIPVPLHPGAVRYYRDTQI